MMRGLILASAILLASTSSYGTIKNLTWDDLKPSTPAGLVQSINSLGQTDKAQLRGAYYKADLIYRVKNYGLKKELFSAEDKRFYSERYAKHLDGIASKMVKYEREDAHKFVTPQKGKVQIRGFALPLDIGKGLKFRSFMLVPVVGACIHVPAPPANQMIFVTLSGKDGVELPLYAAVTVQGELKAQELKSKANFHDGQSMIDSGYIISGANVVRH